MVTSDIDGAPPLWKFCLPRPASDVFLLIDRLWRPPEPPYEGPFKIIESSLGRIFTIDVRRKSINVNVEWLKPACMEVLVNVEKELPTPATSGFPVKTYPDPRTKRISFATSTIEPLVRTPTRYWPTHSQESDVGTEQWEFDELATRRHYHQGNIMLHSRQPSSNEDLRAIS